MKKIVLSILVPALIAVTLFTCSKQDENKEKQKAPLIDESAVAVTVTEIREGEFSVPILSSGLINTGTESRLSFKVGGIISKILVTEGESVSKGQLLASLDLTEIDAQLSQSKNNFDKTVRDLERVQRLYKDSAATLEQVQNVQTAYDVANEGFRIASFNRQFATIHANASGKVIRKFVNEGEQVSGGSPILMTNSAQENDWVVRVGLPDVDWVRVKIGDHAIVKTDAYSGQKFDAVVTLINEGADPVSGLYLVEVKIKAEKRKLATGLVASVEIIPSQKQMFKSIPIEALVEGDGDHAYVFVTSDDEKGVKKLPVRVGYIQGNNVMVAEGLDNVTKVITAGSAFLTEFSTIKVTL